MAVASDYKPALDWPWTKDKFFAACPICGMGMFYPIDAERDLKWAHLACMGSTLYGDDAPLCKECSRHHVVWHTCLSAYKHEWEQEHGVEFYPDNEGHDRALNHG